MHRTLRLALVAAFAIAAVPSFSQSSSPSDSNAWAVYALGKMRKSGLLKDYPEGLFREGRPASRVEIAVATHAAYMRLAGASQGLGGERNKLENAIARADDPNNPVFSKADLESIRTVLSDARIAAGSVRDLAEDAANLVRLAQEYQDELEDLGVDVASMKSELIALSDRVSKLEQDDLPFNLDVEWNLVTHLGHSRGGNIGLTVDGRPTGLRPSFILGQSLPTAGLTQDVSAGHEMAILLDGETNPLKWKAAFAVGNLVGGSSITPGAFVPGGIYGNQSTVLYDTQFRDDARTNFYVQNFEVEYDGTIADRPTTIRAGRVAYQGIPMVFRRMDTTPYFFNRRWDDHNWYFDGAVISIPFQSGARLDAFGGRQGFRQAKEATPFEGLWPMSVGELRSRDGSGNLDVAQHLGFAYWQKPARKFSFALNYIFLEGERSTYANSSQLDYDRMVLFGFDGKYELSSNCDLNFGKGESTYKRGDHTVEGSDNRAYWANVGWRKGRANGNVGWRQIEPYYGAPGDWGRMGINWRAPDHKGWFKTVNYFAGPSDSFALEAYEAQGMSGTHDVFDRDERLRGINFDWQHRLTGRLAMLLGYETFRSRNDGDQAQFEWFRLGFDHDLGGGSFFKMMYESSNASADSDTRYNSDYGSRRRGGLVTMQLGRRY